MSSSPGRPGRGPGWRTAARPLLLPALVAVFALSAITNLEVANRGEEGPVIDDLTGTESPVALPTAAATPTVTPAPTAAPGATPSPTPTAAPTGGPTDRPTTSGTEPATSGSAAGADDGPPPPDPEPGFDPDAEGPLDEPEPPPGPSSGVLHAPEGTWVFRFAHDEPDPDNAPTEVRATCTVDDGEVTCDPADELDGAALAGELTRAGGDLVWTHDPTTSWGRLALTATSVGVGEDGDQPCEMAGSHVHDRGARSGSSWAEHSTGTWLAYRLADDC